MKSLTINSALTRLTFIYTLVLLGISLVFSISLYSVSSRELDNNVNLQTQSLSRRPDLRRGLDAELIGDIRADVQESKERLRTRMVLVNIAVFMGGALFSYALAKKTLTPIEEAHQARARFTADASHELRTPVAAMRAEIDVALRDKGATKTELADILNSNREELVKLTSLSESLLRIARGDTAESPGLSSTKIEPVISGVVKKMSKLAKQNKVSLQSNTDEKVSAKSNRNSLEEILIILIDNGMKYSGAGSTITCSSYVEGGKVVVTVSDNGPGIKESDIDRIFERFYRTDASRNSAGHGLGLSLARQIAESVGASISAEPNESTGVTFKITMPVPSKKKPPE